jgi:hypothetical protein
VGVVDGGLRRRRARARAARGQRRPRAQGGRVGAGRRGRPDVGRRRPGAPRAPQRGRRRAARSRGRARYGDHVGGDRGGRDAGRGRCRGRGVEQGAQRALKPRLMGVGVVRVALGVAWGGRAGGGGRGSPVRPRAPGLRPGRERLPARADRSTPGRELCIPASRWGAKCRANGGVRPAPKTPCARLARRHPRPPRDRAHLLLRRGLAPVVLGPDDEPGGRWRAGQAPARGRRRARRAQGAGASHRRARPGRSGACTNHGRGPRGSCGRGEWRGAAVVFFSTPTARSAAQCCSGGRPPPRRPPPGAPASPARRSLARRRRAAAQQARRPPSPGASTRTSASKARP